MATKTGLLLSKTVRDEARSLGKVDGSALLSVVIESLKKSPQFKLPFLQRGAFLKNILEDEDSKDRLQQLVCLFAEDYSQLFLEGKRVPASVRYCLFQIRWLQRVRLVVERGERALADAQCDGDDNDVLDERGTSMAKHVTILLLLAYGSEPVESRSVLAVFHTIAREVYMYQQTRASSISTAATSTTAENERQDEEDEVNFSAPVDSDDTLYRICGAQMHRMIEVRKSKLKAHGGASSKLMSELQFLGQLVMSKEEKEKFLPLPLKSTERGGHTFPKLCMLPFMQRIVTQVKAEITDEAFKRYGENLFKVKQHLIICSLMIKLLVIKFLSTILQVTETKLQCDRCLFECFLRSCSAATTDQFPEEVKQACAVELVSKITNCCKKDWDVTRKRQQQHLHGNATTLNLRDILKAHVAK